MLALNEHHPCIKTLRMTLREMSGDGGYSSPRFTTRSSREAISPTRPLGHRSPYAFRILFALDAASEPLTALELVQRMPDASPPAVREGLRALERHGVVTIAEGGGYVLAAAVPSAFRSLVAELGRALGVHQARVANMVVPTSGRRPVGFARAADGAPRLFGTDVRFRNLMALAKHGPMHLADLRRIVGTPTQMLETRSVAPFGRGGLVEVWESDEGTAVRLDPAFPAFVELKALLIKMEERHPLAPSPFARVDPRPPVPKPWGGDKHALFGSDIPTGILMTIGVQGWTFETLCVATAIGYDRVVVKKVLKRLESDGILGSSRARRPGFNVRAVLIAETFIARNELKALLERCVEVWPEYGERVRHAMKHLPPRTQEHLRRRKLVEPAAVEDPAESVRRQRCVHEYQALATRLGHSPTCGEVMAMDSRLSRRIRACWGPFSEFRKHVGLAVPRPGTSIRRNAALRERCIREYSELAARLGHQPNTAELNRRDGWLCERIRTQWGGFPEFCEEVGICPARRHRSAKTDDATRRAASMAEYRTLAERLGYAPSSWELRLHTDGLYKRIKEVWPSFEAFCDDVGVAPARMRRNRSLPSKPGLEPSCNGLTTPCNVTISKRRAHISTSELT